MADIELVIKIPEKIYDGYMNYTENYVDFMFFGTEEKIVRAIRNGTPLPKGHGRLIDEDEFISDIKKHYFDNETVIRCVEITLDNASTIIEADKEQTDETDS